MAQNGAGQIDLAMQVEGEDFVEGLCRGIAEVLGAGAAGVAEHGVDFWMAGKGGVHHLVDGGMVGHIHLQIGETTGVIAALCQQGGGFFRRQGIGQHHKSTGIKQGADHGFGNAAQGTGHEDGFVVEVEVHGDSCKKEKQRAQVAPKNKTGATYLSLAQRSSGSTANQPGRLGSRS